jgi:hypothetical protein
MIKTRTLQFENARAVQSLYANDFKLLKNLEDSLGVKVTTREGWVKLEGESERVDKAQRVFDQLEVARQQGVEIHKHEFNYALNSVNESREDNLGEVVATKISTSARKPPIVARSAGQRSYVEAIQKHDVVFGIGPAGTGKTYLAVAMAVAALKKEQVSRIILTRPAFCRAICRKKSRLTCDHSTTLFTICSSRRRLSDWSRARRLKSPPSLICADAPSVTPLSFSMKPKIRPRNRCSCS